jgi:hypothetical protein
MRKIAWQVSPVMLAWLLAVTASAGENVGQGNPGKGELVLFTSADATALDSRDPVYDRTELDLAADIFGSWHVGSFRVLGELLLSTEEQELERLQLGWEVAPNTLLWLGRFHQPASAWNVRNHHGLYLQPSITRPAIEEWEDDGGVLPQHVEGLLAETRLPLGETHGLLLAAGVGIGPVMTAAGLESLEIFSPRTSDRRPSYSLHATFLPDFAGDNGMGIVASHSEIGLEDAAYVGPAKHVDLGVLGLFIALKYGSWEIDSALYAVRSRFVGEGGKADQFTAGYLQLTRQLGSRFSVVGRFEGSADSGSSSYLALFPDFVRQRAVLDLRWDFAERQAIAIEFADTHARSSDYREFRLQWSAAFR